MVRKTWKKEESAQSRYISSQEECKLDYSDIAIKPKSQSLWHILFREAPSSKGSITFSNNGTSTGQVANHMRLWGHFTSQQEHYPFSLKWFGRERCSSMIEHILNMHEALGSRLGAAKS